MASYNRVILLGNLTRDPELKRTPKGSAVAEIGLAVNRVWTDDNGQKREEVTFVDVTFWGRQAEIVHKYCTKGKPLFIEGRLQTDSWEDKATGQKRSKLRVIAENMQLLGSGKGESAGDGSADDYEPERVIPPRRDVPSPRRPAQSAPPAADYGSPLDNEDDCPF